MQTLAILFVDVETLYWTCVLHKFTHRFCGRRPDTESVTTPDKSTNHILEELDKKILIIFTVRCSRLHPIWRSIPSTYTITVLHPFILLRFIGAIDMKQAFLWRKLLKEFPSPNQCEFKSLRSTFRLPNQKLNILWSFQHRVHCTLCRAEWGALLKSEALHMLWNTAP